MTKIKIVVLLLILWLLPKDIIAQRLEVNGGFLAKAEITLGNQNQWLKLGLFGFGTANFGDIAIESGLSLASYTFLKRHTVKQKGLAYSYEFFVLGGVGQNSNLLGAATSEFNNTIVFNANGESGFHGLGFGFGKDYLPQKLKPYGLRKGQIIIRSSNAFHSLHIVFQNDVRLYRIFNGEGTDYGSTGSLTIGFANIVSNDVLYRVGAGIELFTARPDYSRAPRNPTNSDDGRKNVWFTLPPFRDLFYSNLYAFGIYQDNQGLAFSGKLGINSQKLGAFVQNTLHDGFGLNPRFPWDVTAVDKIIYELSGNVFFNATEND